MPVNSCYFLSCRRLMAVNSLLAKITLLEKPANWTHLILVAPYCAIPRDYLSDTPLLRAMGFLVSQHGQLGAIPPPPFLSVFPLESMQSGGAIPPPPPKGVSQRYVRDIILKQDKWVRYPPLRYYLERVLRDRGGSAFAKRGACKRGLRKLGHGTY